MKEFTCNGIPAHYRYVIKSWDDKLVVASYIAHTKQVVRSVGASIKRGFPVLLKRSYVSEGVYTKSEKFRAFNATIRVGYDNCQEGFVINESVGNGFLLTTKETLYQDFYNALMLNYELPLDLSWMETLYECLLDNRNIRENGGSAILRTGYDHEGAEPIRVNGILLDDLLLVDYRNLTEDILERTLSELLSNKEIVMANKPQERIACENITEYIEKYGKYIVENISEFVKPRLNVDGTYDLAVSYNKRLKPAQADSVNGVIDCLNTGRYAIMNHGMGCGKTFESIMAAEGYMVQKCMRKHPELTLKDIYSDPTLINYRTIVMAPGFLVKKWKEEIESEIPFSRAVIIESLSQLVELQKMGRKPVGKTFYIISKDFGKLSYTQVPVPTKVIHNTLLKKSICTDCGRDKEGTGNTVCLCGSRTYKLVNPVNLRRVDGMVCPDCGELLIQNKTVQKWEGDEEDGVVPLMPSDFSVHTKGNDKCWYCGANLWAPYIANIGGQPENKWYRAKRYKNAAKNSTENIWILKGWEEQYVSEKRHEGCKTIHDLMPAKELRVRRTSPLRYLFTHLKGYFDFAILDEVHKYKSGNSAQGIAAGWVIASAKKTIALTGTLSGGKAEDLFYLLFRLDPARMIENGYEFTSCKAFSDKYGCIESHYEVDKGEDEDADYEYNSSTRGAKVGQDRVMPGVSPLVFTDFLIDRTVFLDLSDMSNQMPPLNEYVVGIDLDEDVKKEYKNCLEEFKELYKKEKRSALSSELQFALSYADKPYGRSPVLSTKTGKEVIFPPDMVKYRNTLLNKEKKLVEIVQKEMDEGRNVFIYAEYTGKPETCITGRLKSVLEKNIPGLMGNIAILESGKPEASERMDWIMERAAEGKRVIITNPALCECGLDFIFTHKGKQYNYNTIIMYQMGYNLYTLWQSVSRHYRLIQTEECRTYYLYSKDTIQLSILKLMAQKKTAVGVLQGCGFSSEGLEAMADGIDTELVLAKALHDGIKDTEEEVSKMYERKESKEKQYAIDFKAHALYHELLGIEKEQPVKTDRKPVADLFAMFKIGTAGKKQKVDVPVEKKAVQKVTNPVVAQEPVITYTKTAGITMLEKTTNKKNMCGQMLLFVED